MDQNISTTALGPSIDDFHIALKAAVEKALDAVKYEEGNGGSAAARMAAGNPNNIDIGDEDDLEKAVRETFRLFIGNLHSDHTHHDEFDLEKRVRETLWLMKTALGPSIDDFRIALKAALEKALDAVKYEAGNGGWAAAIMAAGNPNNIDIGDEDDLEKTVRETLRLMGNLRSDHAHHDLTVARQLHHLYSIYFTGQPHLWRGCDPKAVINSLARMSNRIESNSLWPDGSWISIFHKPNPTWLSDDESNSVVGDLEHAVEYKKMLRRLGYAPVSAPTKAALDKIWHDLYNIDQPEYSKLEASANTNMSRVLPISSLDKYAVVSYVQRADGTKPPALWTAEVDSVLSGLVELGVIPEKVVWFDKLASRQYKDSQKWWGAAGTMQFLFNPIIVILPRMSEHSLFALTLSPSIWGSGAAIDGMYANFLDHARTCKECQSSFALRWALKQDHVIPAASLRTWPRVEHALGASGLGIFTSETTYSALVACLTCAFAMFGALLKNDPALHHQLASDATPLPSTYLKEDGSMLIGGWVIVSCSDWHYSCINEVLSMACLKDMASCLMELHSLFCQLHIPRLVTLGRKGSENTSGALVYDTMIRLPEASGLFYPEGGEDVDVPTLARFNSNSTYRLDLSENDKLDEHTVVGLYHHWALLEIQKNQPQEEISTDSFVTARKKALSTLVYTKAAQAPCYSWSDKLVAAILLSLPNMFAEAVTFWNDRSDKLTRVSSLILSRAGCITELDESDQEIEWEPNTLIVALAILQFQKHHLHRLVPRPPGIEFSPETRVSVQPFVDADDSQSKHFAAFFLGHLPPRSLDALSFHTKANTSLPHVKEWVHKTLQDGALCNMNVVVIRSMQPAGERTEDIKHCWHCQKHRRVGEKHSANDSGGVVIDILTLQDFVHDMLDAGNTDESVVWGLGSFDPLNLAALSDEDSCFGVEPDTVAVLLKHRQAGENSAGTSNSSTILHAYGLAHFCILGNKGTSKCNACHAIIIQEKYHGKAIAIWTIVPMVGYKSRFNSIPGFAGIG